MFGPLVSPGIAGIGKDRLFPAVQQRCDLGDVAALAAVLVRLRTTPEATSTPICAFIPKCH